MINFELILKASPFKARVNEHGLKIIDFFEFRKRVLWCAGLRSPSPCHRLRNILPFSSAESIGIELAVKDMHISRPIANFGLIFAIFLPFLVLQVDALDAMLCKG